MGSHLTDFWAEQSLKFPVLSVPVYTAGTEVKPSEIARRGLEEAKKIKMDVVIVDTAGRLQVWKIMFILSKQEYSDIHSLMEIRLECIKEPDI